MIDIMPMNSNGLHGSMYVHGICYNEHMENDGRV